VAPPAAAAKSPFPAKAGLIDVLRLFVIVTVCATLVVPTVWVLKVNSAGARVSGNTAVPFTSRIWVPMAAVSVRTTAPLMVPDDPSAGVKVVLRVQVWPAARTRLTVHGAAPLPMAAKSPLDVMVLIVSAVALAFLTVTLFAALVVPAVWLAKVIVAGVNVSGGVDPPVPVPVSAISCGESDVPFPMVTAPLIAPFDVGVNVAAILQVAFDASVAPQVVPLALIA